MTDIDDLTISYEETVAGFSDEKLLEEYALLSVAAVRGMWSLREEACKKEILKRMEGGAAFSAERNMDLHRCQAENRYLRESSAIMQNKLAEYTAKD